MSWMRRGIPGTTVKACVGTMCQQLTIDRRLVQGHTTVQPTENRPNGPSCEPDDRAPDPVYQGTAFARPHPHDLKHTPVGETTMSTTTWMPTRKWLATQSTALATLAVAWVNAGTWNKPLSIATIGLVSQAVVGYLVPNVDPAKAPSAPATELVAAG